MPIPVSATMTSSASPTRRTCVSIRPCAGVNFTAFESRLYSTCLNRPSSAYSGGRWGARRVTMVSSFLSASGRIVSCTLQRRLQLEPRRVQLHPARLDSGEVQDIVDEPQQVLTTL